MKTLRDSFRNTWHHTYLMVAITLGIGCCLCCSQHICWSEEVHQPVTTVLAIRHAEKRVDAGNDPSLSAAGQVRAQELVHVIGQSGVSAIYATQFVRTQQTVQPLAKAVNVPMDLYPAAGLAELVAMIKKDHAGGVIVVAGHSNTIPALVKQFGCDRTIGIDDHDHDNLYVLTVCEGYPTRVVELQYGESN